MNQRLILPRDSCEETTSAVVEFAGCAEGELLARLRRALKLWARTAEGQDAVAEACGDFNVGGLAPHTPAGAGREGGLSRCLLAAGITRLDTDVHSQDGVVRGWDFDTRLA